MSKRRRIGLFALAFLLVTGAALASMVRFTGPRAAPRAAAAALDPVANGEGFALPIEGLSRRAIVDTWGQARDGGARPHQGTDIVAPRGTPIVAVAASRVEKLFTSRQGGLTVYLRSADGRRIYYYAHLDRYAPGLAEGERLAAGDPIGAVGDSGNAGRGNTHLHFEVHEMARGEPWWRGRAVNPYPLLARAAGGR